MKSRVFRGLGWACWITCLAAGVPASLPAQVPLSPAQFDPGDVYYQGYLAVRAAEELEKSGDFAGAIEKLERASQMFGTVKKFYPDWKPEMVAGRSVKTDEAIARVRPKADEKIRKDRSVVAELEGGPRVPASRLPENPADRGVLEVDPLALRRLRDAEAERERLRKQLAEQTEAARRSEQGRADAEMRGRNATAQEKANAAEREELLGRNADLARRLEAAEDNVSSLRSRLAAAPMQSELDGLNRRIETLEQERRAMATALSQSRDEHEKTMARAAILEADLGVARQKIADLERNLKVERTLSNEVVAGQRRQLDILEKKLADKDAELAKANERIAGLAKELNESREAFADLRDERDSLLRERDQMAALLKLNEAGRIQDLIEQNMALARDLREANERVDRLNRESNADKDAITEAKRDLAIAKAQINRLMQEKREQDQRLADMEERLRREEKALADGTATSDPAEVETLREIIRRQLRVQERRRQARDLLVEAARDLGKGDQRLSEAIDLFNGQEIQLTVDEMKLVADRQVDGEFVSPVHRDAGAVGRNTEELYRDIAAFERAAEKAYLSGRYLSTREIYQTIIDQHPGHTPSLCKVGVVHLRLGEADAAADAFRRAVEMDGNNPYAHRMLGFSLMKVDNLAEAENHLRRSVELAPDDAMSQTLLAMTCYRQGRRDEAEAHFKAAITADPMASDPYYNLSLIAMRKGNKDDARELYQQALERGALPDPGLERKLDSP